MKTTAKGIHPRRHRAEGQRCLPFGHLPRGRHRRHIRRARAPRPYPALPVLARTIVAAEGLPVKAPAPGHAVLYELAATADGPTVYVGQTRQAFPDRLSGHVSLARHRVRKNRRLEAWLRRLAVAGGTLVMRVVDHLPAGEMADAAERTLIASHRAGRGTALLNQGPGGEHAPAGRLVPPEERERARVARCARQREEGYRRNQSAACSRRRHRPAALDALLADFAAANPAVTMVEICRRHGLTEGALLSILRGGSNGLVVNADLLAAAQAAQTRREVFRAEWAAGTTAAALAALQAYLAAPPGATLTAAAQQHALAPQRLLQAVQRRSHGIPDALARAVRARMDEDGRHRGRALGWRAARVDSRLLRWLLQAYTRPGSRLTLSIVAARLGITQGAISHLLAGRKGRPLPRRLLLACRRRARARRYGANRASRAGAAR